MTPTTSPARPAEWRGVIAFVVGFAALNLVFGVVAWSAFAIGLTLALAMRYAVWFMARSAQK